MDVLRQLRIAGAALVVTVAVFGIAFSGSRLSAQAETSAITRATEPLRALDVPGWTVLVTERDGTTTRRSHGTVDARPVTGKTPFLWGSVSKSFTATLVAVLAHEGTVDLDRPVRGYLPDFALAGGRGRTITVRQLLAHTSGIGESAGLERAEVVDDSPGALQRLVRSLREVDPVAEPGAAHAYSSANYLVLGAMVEEVTGQSFATALTERVLRPLGMSGAITTAPMARRSHLTSGHRYLFGTPREFDHPYVSSGVAYGYLASGADDLARYARFHAGVLDKPTVLPARRVSELHQPQARVGPGEHYALGWRTTRYDGLDHRIVQHTGATPGSFAHVLIDPKTGRTVVVLADAYSESIAPALAGVGPDLLRAAEGVDLQPQQTDPVLSAAPWVVLAVAVVGLLAALAGLRALIRPRRRGRRGLVAAAVLAAVLAVALTLLPRAVGFGWRELRLWMPDVAGATFAGALVWALAAVVLMAAVARRTRQRAPTRGVLPDPPPTVGSADG